jgi:hypothetical protein
MGYQSPRTTEECSNKKTNGLSTQVTNLHTVCYNIITTQRKLFAVAPLPPLHHSSTFLLQIPLKNIQPGRPTIHQRIYNFDLHSSLF